MKQSNLLIAAIAALSIGSCKSKLKPATPTAGDANFATYVAIGNSLTSGFADGSLYRSGQENSYPSMLAEQFQLVGGGAFKQPLLPGESGWPILPAAGYYPKRILGPSTDTCTGATSLGPIIYPGLPDTAGSATNISAQGPFNNVGIPGIRCIDYLFQGYGIANPYAGRFFSSPGTQRPLDVALLPVPTFFTMWLGSNDVLGYATGGGTGAVGGTAIGDISPVAVFKASYDATVKALTDIGAKGVLINIPDVTTIPYFTTIPAKGLVLTQQAQVDALNAAYAPLHITFTLGANYFIMADSASPGGLRQMTAGDYVCLSLPQTKLECGGWGSSVPIPDQYVLDAGEVASVKAATTAFNQIIAADAAQYNLGLFDANTYLRSLQSGVTWNGVTYTPTFVTGGAFSLDGVHLTPRGYALVANQILNVINTHYHSTLPEVDINSRHGILFP
jgi:phospholipase/lecithinase/hemolysin